MPHAIPARMLGTILLVWAALSGSIVDAATGRPIAGARVRTVARPDGGWEVAVCAPGYLDTFQHGRAGEGVGRIELFPAAPGPEVEARILAERAARPRGLAAEGAADLRPQARAILEAHEAGQTPPIAYTLAAPPTIRVWRRGVDGSTASCSGRVDTLALEDYVKGVVPHEWISSWQAESLKAGAMAARSYAWYWVAAGGKYSCADVDDTTASQVYRDSTNSATDAAAVASTAASVAELVESR